MDNDLVWLQTKSDLLKNKFHKMKKKKKNIIFLFAYTIVFICTFFIAYSPFLEGEKTFIWQADGRTQHYPLYVYIGRTIRKIILGLLHFKFQLPLFDLSIGLGNDTIGFIHSLGGFEPLLLLTAFFPTSSTESLYIFLVVFRLYLSGISFLYLCSYFKKQRIHAIIGSVIYCFSGYAIYSAVRHPYFIFPMIVLPLLVAGLDKILCKDHPHLFVIAVFLSAVVGYYHLYMMTILLVLYAIIRFFSIYQTNRIKEFICALLRAAGSYVLGIGVSAIIMFPSLASFLDASRSGFTNYTGSYDQGWYRTQALRFISPPGSWSALSFAAIALFAITVLFLSNKDKRTLKIITFVTFFIYLSSIGCLVMNGFQYSSERWTFGVALVVAYIVVETLPDLLHLTPKNKIAIISIALAYIIYGFSSVATRKTNYWLVGALFLFLTLILLVMLSHKVASSCRFQQLGSSLLLLLVMYNVGINGLYKFSSDQGNYANEFKKIGEETERFKNVHERELEPYLLNNPSGRADGPQFGANRMAWNIPSFLIFNSVESRRTTELWSAIENSGSNQKFNIQSTGQQTLITTLLSQKYFVESSQSKVSYVPYGYSLIKTTENNNAIYENNYALPWGYTYDLDKAISYDSLNKLNGLQKQEAMLQTIALDSANKDANKEVAFSQKELSYEAQYKDCTWENGVLTVKQPNATITISFQANEHRESYLRLIGLDINGSGVSSFTINVNSGDISRKGTVSSSLYSWYYGKENYLFNLGYHEEEIKTAKITFPSKGKFKLKDIEIYELPMENYVKQVEVLRAEPLENIQWETNKISGTIDLSKDKILCMSIPYSKGWSATVDGQKAEILCGNYMFMAVPLTEGHHEIEFEYCSPGLKLGIAVSIASWAIFLIHIIRYRKRRYEK